MAEEQIVIPLLFPGVVFKTSLENWVGNAMKQATQTEQYLLEEIVHYKALAGLQHEFLVVCASHPSHRSIYLGIDRNGGALAASKQVLSEASFRSLSSFSFSSSGTRLCRGSAYDAVQISYAGSEPILAQYEETVKLSTISFAPLRNAAGQEQRTRPSLLHLCILLRTIHDSFPCYSLLQHQCYFFARATSLTLKEHFGGTEEVHTDGWRAATLRCVHVSSWSAMPNAVNTSVLLPWLAKSFGLLPVGAKGLALLAGAAKGLTLPSLFAQPALFIPHGLLAAYSAVALCRKGSTYRRDKHAIDQVRLSNMHSDIVIRQANAWSPSDDKI
jgi:hypothetical protein